MSKIPRNQSFILAAGNSGPLIMSRNDFNINVNGFYGVGAQLLNCGAYEPKQAEVICNILSQLRYYRKREIVVIDGGANIGVFTVEMAKHMAGWGRVLAVEPQRWLYYALCGNMALNNCFNAIALRKVLAERPGEMLVPSLDFERPGSYGSLELERHDHNEDIGQPIGNESSMVEILPIDKMVPIGPVDFIKLDIEGMEISALYGAGDVVDKYHPVIFVETLKSDKHLLYSWFENKGYVIFTWGDNLIAIYRDDHRIRATLPELTI